MHVIEDIVAADVVGQAPTAVIAVDTGLRVAIWNPAAEKLFGIAADAAVGRSLLELVIPENRHALARQIGDRAAAGRAWQGEFDVRRGDGSPLRVHAAIGPLTDADGRAVGIVATALEAERADDADRGRRLELLVQTSEILAASVDAHAGLQSVARIAAAWLADLVVIDLLDADGRLERVAVAHAQPERAELAEGLRGYPPSPDAPDIRRVLTEGRAEVVADLTEAALRERVRDSTHLDIVQRLGVRSAMFVPLAARGRVLGVMLLAGGSERAPFGPPDQAMAEDIARRVALALDGASLLREAREAARVARSLQRITDAALAHLELDDLLPVVLDRLHTELGTDSAAVLLTDVSGTTLEMRAALGFEQSPELLRIPFGTGVAGRIAESVEPMVFDDLGPSDFVNASLRSAGVRSMLGAPLRIGRRVLGVVQVGSVERRHFTDDEIELIRLAAGRIALAVDHAHLYQAETLARGRLTLMAESSEVLGESLDYRSALAALARLLVPWLADWCLIEIAGDPAAGIAAHADPAMIPAVEELAGLDDERAASRVARTGVAELATVAAPGWLAAPGDAARLQTLERLGLRSAMVVPLRSRGRTHGVITLATSLSDRRYDESDLAFASELARRAATAVDTARLYQDRDQVARTLQRTLLPPTLPDIPFAEIAAIYHPAGAGSEIGGDFYDAFETGDGGWTIAIGDVCGKGAAAAAITGLARHTLRATAFREPSPRAILERLNRALLREVREESFCTVAAGRLTHHERGALLTASAGGHPAPLVIRNDGTVEDATLPGTLLGIYADVDVRDRETVLEPGESVVFYTDGVTEERRGGEQFGEERLRGLLASCAGLSATGIAERIERGVLEFQPVAPADDMAVVVVRIITPR
ncbi:MAG TPA: SpoIIE family protein phosphatase [Gaiellales bacterium]|nr:SpoIIE family protein phosphatase [Gaiellales bacterium]